MKEELKDQLIKAQAELIETLDEIQDFQEGHGGSGWSILYKLSNKRDDLRKTIATLTEKIGEVMIVPSESNCQLFANGNCIGSMCDTCPFFMAKFTQSETTVDHLTNEASKTEKAEPVVSAEEYIKNQLGESWLRGEWEVGDVIDMMESYAKEVTEALKSNNEKEMDIINTIFDIADETPELNMGNYNDDDVYELNNAMIEIYNVIDDFRHSRSASNNQNDK